MANKYRSVLASVGTQPTGNAVPADVLSGKTFSNADGIDKVGTMVNRGAVSQTLNAGESYTIPVGYHNGNGVVTASGTNLNYDFAPAGFSWPTLGTNYTIGKHYGIIIYATTAHATSFTGATINKEKSVGDIVYYDVTATATTITAVGAQGYAGALTVMEYD